VDGIWTLKRRRVLQHLAAEPKSVKPLRRDEGLWILSETEAAKMNAGDKR
jgi:hypothetical protein